MATTENIEFENTTLTDDALDRRAALNAAVEVTADGNSWFSREHDHVILARAEEFYAWLRGRDTLKLHLSISAGTPVDRSSAPTAGE